MKKIQKRRLITFSPILVYNNYDFIRDVKTFAIRYTLNKQKYRRTMYWKISNELLRDMDVVMLAKVFWDEFKKKLNIVQVR